MSNKVVVFEVPAELADYVESLHYEVEARKSLLKFMIEQGLKDTDGFSDYHKEYMEEFAKYQIAMDEISNTIVVPQTNGVGGKWELDFQTKQVTVQVGVK